MGQLVVSVAGAAIGSLFGQPEIGWLVGSYIGSQLFSKGGNINVEGPRLGDLTVQSSAYGVAIPYGYGTVRMAGNIIWSSGIVETKHTQSQSAGGKGGKKQTQTSTTYTYSASFAVGLSEGIAGDVLRIWADSKIIFDKGSDTVPSTRKEGLVFRFYPGSEDQLPDGLIVADVGAANAPAHRGLCYLIFDNLQLVDYGNRIPNITAEVVFNEVTVIRPVITGTLINDTTYGTAYSNSQIAIDYKRLVGYFYGGSYPNTFIRRFQWGDMVNDRIAYDIDIFPSGSNRYITGYGFWCSSRDGYLYVTSDGANSQPISKIDPNSMTEVALFGSTSISLTNTTTSFVASNWFGMASATGSNGQVDFLICGGIFSTWGILKASDLSYVYGAGINIDETRNCGIISGGIYEGYGDAFIIGGHTVSTGSPNLGIYQVRVAWYANYDGFETDGVTVTKLATIAAADLIDDATTIKAAAVGYDPSDNGLLIHVIEDAGATPQRCVFIKYIPGTGILWNTEVPFGLNITQSGMGSDNRLTGELFSWYVLQVVYTLDLRTGELTSDSGWPGHGNAASFYDAYSETYTFIRGSGQSPCRLLLGKASSNGQSLAAVVTDICDRSGLDISDLDITDLTDTVTGYVVGRPATARAALLPLSQAFFFDGVESDYLLKFVKRGSSSVTTINQRDLGILAQDTNEYWKEVRTQEVELPERVNVMYMDKENDYQQAVQFDKRVSFPSPTMSSKNQVQFEVALVLTADEAKQMAQKVLYTSWVNRVSYSAIFSWKYLLLDPTDVISVVLDSGSTFVTRLVKLSVGADLSIQFDGLSEQAATYDSDATGSTGDGLPQDGIPGSGYTKLFLLDVPLLRDIDDTAGLFSQTYYMMAGFGPDGWPGALLYKSSDNASYIEAGQSNNEGAWGSALNALPDCPDPFQTDNTSTLTVYMTTEGEELTSCTQLQMLNGANPAALIKANGEIEVIQYRDVVTNPDGSYTLSGFLRGRRGTDLYVNDHGIGELFILLDTSTVSAMHLGLAELNVTRYYKGVGFGQFFDQADLVTKTNTGRDLKPYAPVHVTATESTGDINLAWVRRTRFNGELRDSVGDVPLNEVTESYQVDILDAPGGTVLRTLVATTQSVVYDSADVITDFGSVPASLTLIVYQMSAAVGRGFGREDTVEVM